MWYPQIVWKTRWAWCALSLSFLLSCATVRIPPVQLSTSVPRGTGLRIAVVGDQQRTSRYEIWRERKGAHQRVVESIIQQKPDALVILGDMVFDGSDDDDWAFYDKLMRPVADARIPCFPIYGNHEYLRSSRAAQMNVLRRFPGIARTWYTVTLDSVTFVMINTNHERITQTMQHDQHRWYDSTMQALETNPATRCVVVCGHHPPFTNSMNVSDNRYVVDNYVPAFLHHPKARLWLSGHSHAYERFVVQGRTFVVAGGGGAPRHKLMTDDEQRHPHAGQPRTRRTMSPFHFLMLQRMGDSLECVMEPVTSSRAPAAPYGS